MGATADAAAAAAAAATGLFPPRSPFPLDFIKCELFIQLLRTAGTAEEEKEDGREMVEGSSIPREFSRPYHSSLPPARLPARP